MNTCIGDIEKSFSVLRETVSERLEKVKYDLDKHKMPYKRIKIVEELEEIQEDVDALERLVKRYLY